MSQVKMYGLKKNMPKIKCKLSETIQCGIIWDLMDKPVMRYN